ncbi:MAG: hypothetical protein PHN32_00865 [Actinomycetota bacterium]|jgi:hypothetical protein|nr:hypothetical protein [Actinomycetota bacterium]
MDLIKDFFSKENIAELFVKFYDWLQSVLLALFGNIGYEPIRDLLVNPYFWIIIFFLLLLGLIFRRR